MIHLAQPIIVDALNSLHLLRPRRSTVSINGPPRAAAAELSTEDVRRDIEDLGWSACPVASVLSIRAGASPVPLATMPPGIPQSSVLGATSLQPPPAVAGKRKQVPRGMVDLLTLPSVEDMSAATPPGPAAVQRASPQSILGLGAASLLPPPAVAGKRKRTPRGKAIGRGAWWTCSRSRPPPDGGMPAPARAAASMPPMGLPLLSRPQGRVGIASAIV